MTNNEKYKDCLEYVDSYWERIIVKPERKYVWKKLVKNQENEKHLKRVWDIPHTFITPNDQKFSHIYYWDSFFMLKGLIGTKREWVLRDMVDNFVYLFEKHGVIPNFNSPASAGRSQPPFLTSMILDTYNGPYYKSINNHRIKRRLKDIKPFKVWLKNVTEVAKREYFDVWDDKDNLFYHKVPNTGLNRYGDRDVGYAHSSELESGWDFTSRFYNRCNEFLPVDLNNYLYKYEMDFIKIAQHLGEEEEIKVWTEKSNKRKEKINKYLWDEKEGFFFDYNFKYKRLSNFLSLAGFTPLWSGLATQEQADKMLKKLKYFETESGLVITAKESLAPEIDLSNIPLRYRIGVNDVLKPKQWDYPYIWPPLEYLTVVGLLKYGYITDAKRIMNKSLETQSRIFKKHGTFFEKTNAVNDEVPENFHYQNQSGFGWTNAVFYRYVQILDSIEKGESFYEIPQFSNDVPNLKKSNSGVLDKLIRKTI